MTETLFDLLATDQGAGKPTATAQLRVLEVLAATRFPQDTRWISEKLAVTDCPLAVNSVGTRLNSLGKLRCVQRHVTEGQRDRWSITEAGREAIA